MTVSFFDESEVAAVSVPSLDVNSTSDRRFILKKRSHDYEKVNISSYNSAFLDGLFADVARVAQSDDSEEETIPQDVSVASEEEARLDLSFSVKRSRLSLTKSFSRCGRSYKNLTEVSSPVGVDTFPDSTPCRATTTKTLEASYSPSMERMDSLHFQLNCVDPSTSPKSVKSVVDIIDMAFPHLPATVSDSSCNKQQDLTQPSDQHESESETNSSAPKESYGWFVDLDTDDDDATPDAPSDPYKKTSSSVDLAFTAPTAPKRVSNYDAEAEWALAADTVDDVLGDFF